MDDRMTEKVRNEKYWCEVTSVWLHAYVSTSLDL